MHLARPTLRRYRTLAVRWLLLLTLVSVLGACALVPDLPGPIGIPGV